MPITPRSGAQLFPISLVRAGFFGLNKQAGSSILPAQWATEALNCVFDSAGRLGARQGHVVQAASAISGTPTIESMTEYKKDDGTTEIIFSASNNKLYKNPTSPSDITGTATWTSGSNDWQFLNFNGNLYAIQQGETPKVYTGTAFANMTAA